MALTPDSPEYLNVVELRARGGQKFKIYVDGGIRNISQTTQGPSTINTSGGGPGVFTENDPLFAFAQWSTWLGGRGEEYYRNDPSRSFDSRNMWSLSDAILHPVPKWYFGTGYRTVHQNMGDDVDWFRLLGDRLYISYKFTVGGSTFDGAKLGIWLRKRGVPGTLTVKVFTDSAGEPNAAVAGASATLTAADVTKFVDDWYYLDLAPDSALSAGTDYHIVIYGAAADNINNHWQIGGDATGTSSNDSSDGSTWAAATYDPYFRYTLADTKQTWHFFELSGASYVVNQEDDGTASVIYILGDRGIATGGASTTLTDAVAGVSGAWVTNEFSGAVIRIVNGVGDGQVRIIASNTGTVITVTEAWDIDPDATSEYVIDAIGSMKLVTPGTTALTGVVTSVAVFNDIAIFAQGQSTDMLRMRWTPGTPEHTGAADTGNKGDLVDTSIGSDGSVTVWRAQKAAATASYSDAVAWGTALTFKTAISCGSSTHNITNIEIHSGQVYITKTNALGVINNLKYRKLNPRLKDLPSLNNGRAIISHDVFLYFNFLGFPQRLYGSSLESFDMKLPESRTGYVSSMTAHPAGVFMVQNASRSGMFIFNKIGFHEIFRGWSGASMRSSFWQPNEGGNKFLWMEVNGDLIYQKYPKSVLSPRKDSTQVYHHSAEMILPTVDFGNVVEPKTMAEITIYAANMTTRRYVEVDYQVDKDIGTDTWKFAGRVTNSPVSSIPFAIGGITVVRLRIRMNSNDADKPINLYGVSVSGNSRTKLREQWIMPINFGETATILAEDGKTTKQLLKFLRAHTTNGRTLTAKSRLPSLHNKRVEIDLGSVTNLFVSEDGEPTGVSDIVLRDASIL